MYKKNQKKVTIQRYLDDLFTAKKIRREPVKDTGERSHQKKTAAGLLHPGNSYTGKCSKNVALHMNSTIAEQP